MLAHLTIYTYFKLRINVTENMLGGKVLRKANWVSLRGDVI